MRRLGPLALVALSGVACGQPRLLDGFTEGQTRLRLAPSEFTGDVVCQRATAGALQAYVVRLEQLLGSEVDAGLATAFTSGSVPCDQAVVFPTLANRMYAADIFGFDGPVAADVDLTTARWTATCGRGRVSRDPFADAGVDPFRPTLSVRGSTVPMRGCTQFGDGSAPPALTQLLVDQPSALGVRTCGPGADQVLAFEATLAGETRQTRCGEPLAFVVPNAERYYTIELTAFAAAADAGGPPPADAGLPPLLGDALDAGADAALDGLDASISAPLAPGADAGAADAGAPFEGGVPRWRTRCIGRALPGLTARAYCDPLEALP